MANWKGYRITSNYGYRKDPFGSGRQVFHAGIDLVKSHKAPIGAFVGGKVLYAGFGNKGTGLGGYGNVVFIEDSKGSGHLYAHLDSVSVKTRQTVKEGQTIGRQGKTGQVTGSHLHYEVRKNTSPSYGWTSDKTKSTVDPTNYIDSFKSPYKPSGSSAKGKQIYFPPNKGNWKVYPLNKKPVSGNQKGEINPTKFGGLTYNILGEDEPHTYIIQTSDFGKVKVYGHPSTDAVVKNKSSKPKGKTLYLPKTSSSWRVYPTNKAPVKGNEKGFLNPKKFGGLQYKVLATPQKDVVTIQTSDFGKVNIYVAPSTGAVIK